jgi:16S rRNA pseudouridine516 synthase
MRLDKFLANSGVGTRSEVKRFIKDKRVKVNGEIVKSDSFNVDDTKDVVLFDDLEVKYKEFYYVLLNKPQGYVSAVIDNVYPPVTDLIPEYAFAKLNPVGRLDVDTTGALLLTNDGDLAHKLISPKYHVDKVYEVEVDKKLDPKLIEAFKQGIKLDGEMTLPAELLIINDNHAELTLHQGKFHQVKRMFKKFEYNVLGLNRKAFAFLTVEDLEIGEYRELTFEEENKLKSLFDKGE